MTKLTNQQKKVLNSVRYSLMEAHAALDKGFESDSNDEEHECAIQAAELVQKNIEALDRFVYPEIYGFHALMAQAKEESLSE